MRYFLFIFLLNSCAGETQNTSALQTDSLKAKDLEHTRVLRITRSELEAGSFVPADGYEADFITEGDINFDGIPDMVMVMQPGKRPDTISEIRSLVLLERKADDELYFARKNDSIIMSRTEAGICCWDPLGNIRIENGEIIIHHMYGSNWRQEDEIVFRYDKEKKDWFFNRSLIRSYFVYDKMYDDSTIYDHPKYTKTNFEDFKGTGKIE